MGLVLNISATPPPPKEPKRRKRLPPQPPSEAIGDPPPQAALPTDSDAVEAPDAVEASLIEPEQLTEHAPTLPKKRSRYVSSGTTTPNNTEAQLDRKQDPSKAAPLPNTLPLERKHLLEGSSTFSAGTFSDLPLGQYLQRQLERMGLQKLTPVQRHTIPKLLSGGDMLVRSPTGSGKTLAYAVPAVQVLLQLGPGTVTRDAGTFALVLVPTRELCLQTHEAVEKLAQPFPWLVCTTIMGGERKKAEKGRLRKGVAMVVGTPGRVCDHIRSTRAWNFSACRFLVLDEADRLLELGFLKDIESVIHELDSRATTGFRRQTVLLSATLSPQLNQLAGRSLSNFVTLQLSASGIDTRTLDKPVADVDGAEPSPGEVTNTNASTVSQPDMMEAPLQLQQSFVCLPPKQRLTGLVAFLRSRCAGSQDCKALVFLSSCDGVDFHFSLLGCGKWPDLRDAEIAAGHAESDVDAAATAAWSKDEDGDGDSDGQDEGTREGESSAAVAAGHHGLSCASELVGTTVLRLHGKLTQQQRTHIFKRFRDLKSGILLCTDIAARGLNLQGIHWIVQYDLPQDPKEYVHRVGRAARLGQLGRAVLFINPSEDPFLRLLRDVGMVLNELKFASFQAALCPNGKRREIYVMELALQRGLEAAVVEQPFLHAAAGAAYQAYMRAYATHSKAVQRVLHIGQLHLGHLAKSFALKEIPTRIGRNQQKRNTAKGRVPQERKRKGLPLAERMKRQSVAQVASSVVSEFAAG